MDIIRNQNGKSTIVIILVVAFIAIAGSALVSTLMGKGDDSASAGLKGGDNPVVAEVNGEEITASDLIDFTKNVPQLQQQPLQQVLPIVREEIIGSKIIDARAKKAKTASSKEVAERLEQAKKNIVRTVFLEQEVAKAITDEALQEAYEGFKLAQADKPKVKEAKASHILVESEDKAKELIKKVNDGADFAELARLESTDKVSGAQGGDLGYFSTEQMIPEFSKAAFALEKGDVSNTPVKSQYGYHIIKLVDKRDRPVPSLEEVRPYLETQLRRELLQKMIIKWRDEADVTLYNFDGTEIGATEETK